jgi:hypothetical protein
VPEEVDSTAARESVEENAANGQSTDASGSGSGAAAAAAQTPSVPRNAALDDRSMAAASSLPPTARRKRV